MRLYLDDDCTDRRLVAELRKAGHEVVLPADIGQGGAKDARHMIYVLREQLPLLSRNYDDFELLHEVVRVSGGHHAGILLIRSDKKRSRNLSPTMIVACMAKLEKAGAPIADHVQVLNHWR